MTTFQVSGSDLPTFIASAGPYRRWSLILLPIDIKRRLVKNIPFDRVPSLISNPFFKLSSLNDYISSLGFGPPNIYCQCRTIQALESDLLPIDIKRRLVKNIPFDRVPSLISNPFFKLSSLNDYISSLGFGPPNIYCQCRTIQALDSDLLPIDIKRRLVKNIPFDRVPSLISNPFFKLSSLNDYISSLGFGPPNIYCQCRTIQALESDLLPIDIKRRLVKNIPFDRVPSLISNPFFKLSSLNDYISSLGFGPPNIYCQCRTIQALESDLLPIDIKRRLVKNIPFDRVPSLISNPFFKLSSLNDYISSLGFGPPNIYCQCRTIQALESDLLPIDIKRRLVKNIPFDRVPSLISNPFFKLSSLNDYISSLGFGPPNIYCQCRTIQALESDLLPIDIKRRLVKNIPFDRVPSLISNPFFKLSSLNDYISSLGFGPPNIYCQCRTIQALESDLVTY